MTEPFHTRLGVSPSDYVLALEAQRKPLTKAQLARKRRQAIALVARRVREELLRSTDWAAEWEAELVEDEPEGDYKRFKATPRMRMVIEWVKPEAVPA
jgi:hypothetical protein